VDTPALNFVNQNDYLDEEVPPNREVSNIDDKYSIQKTMQIYLILWLKTVY
jgi:hypothetical protein